MITFADPPRGRIALECAAKHVATCWDTKRSDERCDVGLSVNGKISRSPKVSPNAI